MYYFGKRYYDSKICRWINTDPALSKFLPVKGNKNNKLPAGGVFEPANMDVYGYVGNNPILFIDPDGQFRFGKRPLMNNKVGSSVAEYMLKNAINDQTGVSDEQAAQLLDIANMEVKHEQGFWDDGSGRNTGYSDKGETGNENMSDYDMSDKVYDDILMDEAYENVMGGGDYKDEDYSINELFSGKKQNNCQDYSDALRDEYKRLYEGKSESERNKIDARVEAIKDRLNLNKDDR